jgi:phosphatidyl-myo-inositol dimannoside synthase
MASNISRLPRVMTEVDSRRRLLLLSSEFPPGPGGIGTHAFQLARHLTRLKWEVCVLTPQAYVGHQEREDFNLHQSFDVHTLPERDAGTFWWARRMQAIGRAVREWKPWVTIATGQRALWTAATLRAIHSVPWVAIGHGTEFSQTSLVSAQLTRGALRSAEAVVAVSDYTAGLIRRFAEPRRLVVIPNAADGERFRPSLNSTTLGHAWGVEGSRVLLTVGRVSERKAQDVVIRALPRILESCPDLVYVMAGLPEKQADFAMLAAELGVGDRVRFTGLIAEGDLPFVYNLADLFVLVSRQAIDGDVEGYGIVVQEAALCGVPAIVSRDCGLTEAISEGQTGVSVPPDDPEAVATVVIDLLKDEERRREMGRHARETALAVTWTERVAEYDRLLRSLLEQRAIREMAG